MTTTTSERMADAAQTALAGLRALATAADTGPLSGIDTGPCWHPAPIGAAVRLLNDWLRDTGQDDTADTLNALGVNSPNSADATTLGRLAAAERSAARHHPRCSQCGLLLLHGEHPRTARCILNKSR